MRKTALLGLPIYDKPSEDKFKLNDWNTANENVERAFSSALNGKSLDIVNTEVAEARGGEVNLKSKISKIDTQLEDKLNKDGTISMANLGQDVKLALTGGGVAVVGAEMVNTININENAVKRETISDDIFNDKTIKTYNATYTTPFVDSSKNYFPSSVLVTLKSSQLINNVSIKAKVRNNENIIKVQPRVESASTVFQGIEQNVNGACEVNEIITVGKTSDRVRVYFFIQGNATTSKYQIVDLDISVNGVKTEILSISDLSVSFGTGTITSTSKLYKGVASKEFVQSVANDVNWTNNTMLIYGDSISDDDFFTTKSHYYDFIKQKTGIQPTSYAVGGSCFGYNSTVTQSIAKWGATNNVLHQIDTYGSGSPKFVCVEAGTNGWGFSAYDLGTIADILNDNSTTFYGYVAKACRKLKTKFPYSKILFMTLLPRYDVTNYMQGKVNNKSNTMKQYSQAIKDVCEAYSVDVLDMYSCSQLYDPTTQSLWWYDRLHPSEKYHEEVFSSLVLNKLKGM